jgi:hypothetical protein
MNFRPKKPILQTGETKKFEEATVINESKSFFSDVSYIIRNGPVLDSGELLSSQ